MCTELLKGTFLSAPAFGQLQVQCGYLALQDGLVQGDILPQPPEAMDGVPVTDCGDCLVLPAFLDMHLHAPQFPMLGTGMDLTLLDWLNRYAFPTEARFRDPDYARSVCRQLAQALIAEGTTRACLFSSLHTDATILLMEELERAGMTALAGKVNMDRNGGQQLQETREESERETLRWLEAARAFPHVRPILTPRFTPACSDALLSFLGRLARERNLPVQSHLSETRDEIAWVRRLRPDCRDYWETYYSAGLWTDRTLMAHCVWSDAAERRAMAAAGVTAVHCPTSNWDLRSGTAPVRQLLEDGVSVVLGSDIAGGAQLSMFSVTAAAIRASKVRSLQDGTKPLTAAEAWYLATGAGCRFFGEKPGFAPGQPLHALVLDDSSLPPLPTPEERLERALYVRQPDAIQAVWASGRQVFSRGGQKNHSML